MNRRFPTIALTVLLCSLTSTAIASLIVEIGDAEATLTPGGGIVDASFDVVFSNPDGNAVALAGYTLFLDIAPAGFELPPGVSFVTPAATYFVGQGAAPLTGAQNPGTINLTPAAGDLGLGQFQTFNGSIPPGESVKMLSVNLHVDQQQAVPGDYPITLNASGQNSLDALSSDGLSVLAQPFNVNDGVLSLTPESTSVPEASPVLIWAFLGLLASRRALRPARDRHRDAA